MQFNRVNADRLAVTCPYCSRVFEVHLDLPPVAAQSSPQPVAPPVYPSPVRPLGAHKRKPPAATNDLLLYGGPVLLVAMLLVGLGGFFGYHAWVNSSKSLDPKRLGHQAAAIDEYGGSTGGDESIEIASTMSSITNAMGRPAARRDSSESSGFSRTNVDESFGGLASSALPATGGPTQSSGFESHSVTSENELTNGLRFSAGESSAPSDLGPDGDLLAGQSLADVIERCEQSVVRIEVTGREGQSLGSGFVVDSEGTLVTNCHVLLGARVATVQFPNGKTGVILGTLVIDQSRDIIVAKINVSDAPPIRISENVPRKGELITALGCPHGLSFTATNGIVSAIRKGLEIDSEMEGTWIQVDTPLSPGNSGGPLIDSNGRVVAMSTLASQGTAQNLNFGISGLDVRDAINQAKSRPLVMLAGGVGRMREKESRPEESRPENLLTGEDIPEQALQQYVTTGVREFSALLSALRGEHALMTAELKQMRRGATQVPIEAERMGLAVARQPIPGEKYHRWFFESTEVRDSVIERQLEKIRFSNQLKSEVKDSADPESLFKLLWHAGPKVDTRRQGSVGYARDIIVINAFNEHDVLVIYDDAPHLVWAPSTSGLYPGTIIDGPVYVQGTATAQLRSGLTTSVTALQLLAEQDLLTLISSGTVNASGTRIWRDQSGRFSVEASLLAQDEDKVVLRKKDGSIVTVPKSNLCQADLDFLGS